MSGVKSKHPCLRTLLEHEFLNGVDELGDGYQRLRSGTDVEALLKTFDEGSPAEGRAAATALEAQSVRPVHSALHALPGVTNYFKLVQVRVNVVLTALKQPLQAADPLHQSYQGVAAHAIKVMTATQGQDAPLGQAAIKRALRETVILFRENSL